MILFILLYIFTFIVLIGILYYDINILDKYKFYYHEYGHVMKIKEHLLKDINNYTEETKSNKVNIKVVEFIPLCRIRTQKRKTYSNYFEYLENKKQEIDYQKIIQDIAINGYEFSKKAIKYTEFQKLCTKLSIITTTFILFILLILKVFNVNNIEYLFIASLIIITIFYITFTISYLFFCRLAYGPPKASKKGMSDHYIFKNPDKFKYTNLEEDTKSIKGKPKILLEIEIDFSDKENPKVNIIKQDTTYKKITKKCPLE